MTFPGTRLDSSVATRLAVGDDLLPHSSNWLSAATGAAAGRATATSFVASDLRHPVLDRVATVEEAVVS